MPAPSPSTNPSRVTSLGREAPAGSSLRVERACIDANAVIGSGWIAASVPPQSTMSARPERIIWVPDAIASAPDAHAETGACAPARAPNSIDTYAAGEFAISIGTDIGSTRRTPFDFITTHPPSGVVAPRPVTTTVGVLLIGNSWDQAQIGRPQSADARSEVEGGGPQPCAVAMTETASPTVTRF